MNSGVAILGYIDPGTGSVILQMLIAGIVGVSLFFRQQVGRVFNFLRGKKPTPDKVDAPVEKENRVE